MTTKSIDDRLVRIIREMKDSGEITRSVDMRKVGQRIAQEVPDMTDLAVIVRETAVAYDKVRGTEAGMGMMWLSIELDVIYQRRVTDMALEHSTAEIVWAIGNMPHLHEVQGPTKIIERLMLQGTENALETRYPEVREALDELLPTMEELQADTRPVEVQNDEARFRDMAAYLIAARVRGDLTTPAGHRPLAICA